LLRTEDWFFSAFGAFLWQRKVWSGLKSAFTKAERFLLSGQQQKTWNLYLLSLFLFLFLSLPLSLSFFLSSLSSLSLLPSLFHSISMPH
jgi:hypothetical protein